MIACASKSLTNTESRYPQLHREALGIVWGMERFSYYLLGKRFTLRSDSKALKFMIENNNRKDIGKRIMSRAEGWFLRLEHFIYNFEHVAGEDNIADAASRICQAKDDPEFNCGKEPQELCVVAANPVEIPNQYFALKKYHIKEELSKDCELQQVIECLNRTDKWPVEIARYQAFQKQLYVQDDYLMKEEKLVLPKELHENVLIIAHRGHPGSTVMKHILRQSLWWLGMDTEVEKFVRSCKECQFVTKQSKPLPISNNQLPKNAWEFVSMDFSTASDLQKWKAIVFTDYYSRFLVAIPMTKTDTDAVKQVLKRVFRTYGIPSTIKSDNGPPFNSSELKNWLMIEWGVKLTHITPLNPSENGLVERSMQGINKVASIAKLTKSSFQEALSEYVTSYNSWPHSVTKIPPSELMFGRPVRTLLPNPRLDNPCYNDEELGDRDELAKFTRNSREDNKRKAGETDIRVGDLVLMMQVKKDKADPIYKDAIHRVINIDENGRVTLMDQVTERIYERNVKHLKKFVKRSGEEREYMKSNTANEYEDTNEQSLPTRQSVRNVNQPKRFLDFEKH